MKRSMATLRRVDAHGAHRGGNVICEEGWGGAKKANSRWIWETLILIRNVWMGRNRAGPCSGGLGDLRIVVKQAAKSRHYEEPDGSSRLCASSFLNRWCRQQVCVRPP